MVGAGISGLAAAIGLQADGHEVTVYERRRDPNPDSAGLSLFRNAFEALDLLGIGDTVRAVSSDAITTMRAGQRTPSGAWLVRVPAEAVRSLRSVHRHELHKALIGALAKGSFRAASAAKVSPDGAPRLTVGEGVEHFDLVVAADGLRSQARAVLRLDPGLRYAGYTVWRGITTGAVDLREEAGETWGRGRVFGVLPLPDDRVYWFGTLSTAANAVFEDEHARVQSEFAGWHYPVEACIASTSPSGVLRHDVYDLASPLATFVKDRTVLLGDAAHAMTPNLGQGAGQGLEDAATLTVLLRGASAAELRSVLERYSAMRTGRTASLLRRSRFTGRIAQARGPVTTTLRNAALKSLPGKLLGTASQRLHRWPIPSE